MNGVKGWVMRQALEGGDGDGGAAGAGGGFSYHGDASQHGAERFRQRRVVRYQPVGVANLVAVPVLQGVTAGAVVCGAALVGGLTLCALLDAPVPAYLVTFPVGILSALAAGFYEYRRGVSDYFGYILYEDESSDGQAQAAGRKVETLQVEYKENPAGYEGEGVAVGGRISYEDLGAPPDLAKRALAGASVTVAALREAGFSDTGARQFRDRLLQFGFVARGDKSTSPYVLTAKGRAVSRAARESLGEGVEYGNQ